MNRWFGGCAWVLLLMVLSRVAQGEPLVVSVRYLPQNNRRAPLAQTFAALARGESLHVVMLGDSIINDMSNSSFATRIEQRYPGAVLTITKSVRGSTGSWWYKQEGRVQQYVLDHNPDLVITGGISEMGDVESIRDVIGQIRTGSLADILVTTGAAGPDPSIYDSPYSLLIDPDGTSYRSRLLRMADEEQAGFIDTYGMWWQFVEDSGEPASFFKRDTVHNNTRGMEVIAESFAAYFAEVPEPTGLALLAVGGLGILPLTRRYGRGR